MSALRAPATIIAIALTVTIFGTAPAIAQPSDAAPASTPKEVRKAEKKARRAKKNAELKELQQHNYQSDGASQSQ